MMIAQRTRSPIEGRQQSADRLVHSREEIVSVLTQAASKAQSVNIRLGVDIPLTTGFTIPAGIPVCQINGGNAYGFRHSAGIDVITIASRNTKLIVQDISFTPINTSVDDGSTFFSCSDTVCDVLTLGNVRIRSRLGILLDPVTEWRNLKASACVFGTDTFFPMTLVAELFHCSFTQCNGAYSVSLIADSVANVFTGCYGDQAGFNSTAASATAVDLSQALIGCSWYTITLQANDVLIPGLVGADASYGHLMRLPAGYATRPLALTLDTAAPALDMLQHTFVRLTLGASSSGNIALAAGTVAGHQLIIACVSNAGTASIPDSGNAKLSAVWNPTADDTLSLLWDGTSWLETARSAN